MACNTIGTVENAQATDQAMLKFLKRCNIDYEDLRKKHLDKNVLRFQFDSARKRMSTILDVEGETTEHGYAKRIHTKGASEIVLKTCTHYLNEEGSKVLLDDVTRQNLESQITDYAKNALRTIAFGYKDLKVDDGGPSHEGKDDGSKIY